MSAEQEFLTAEELAPLLKLPSARSVRDLTRKRKLPVVKIGYRTHRYILADCRAALARLTVKAR